MAYRLALSALQQRGYLTGTGRYLAELFRVLPSLSPSDDFLLYLKRDQTDLFPVGAPNARQAVLEDCPLSPSRRVLWELRHFTRRLVEDRVDLYHGPANFLPLRKVCPYVLTLHDMVYFHNPQRTTRFRAKYWQWMIRSTARHADRLITVSEFSKTQVLKYLPIDPDRIRVIHNGVDERYFEPSPAELRAEMRSALGLDSPYILYIGRLDPDKNVTRIVEAFARLCQDGLKDCRLVVAGAREYRESEILRAVERHRLGDRVVFTGYVKEEHLLPLYQEASVFCYPSLNEGFGLPVLEAMACSVPVVTSNLSSLPEVAGDCGILVDPFSVDAIARGIEEALGTERGRDLGRAGRHRARTFTWHACARRHLAVYREVLGG